jgi:lipopolysaccharide transport system ATP-binding protein
MSEKAIVVENLSKAYRIGIENEKDENFISALFSSISAPVKNFKKLRNLSKFQNDVEKDLFWALKDINFDVNHGEILGIIGKNGAGKSTLLKVLSRIIEPTSGKIKIYGRVASLLEVGTGFNPELTGRENTYLNGAILGMKKKEIDKKFEEIVEFSGIKKFIDTPVKRYSSGMRVRLAFAVAAHLEPEIMIIDEVLAVGDAEFQKKCLGKMGEVARGGRTVLFVSHDLTAIRSLCTTAILLDKGKIIDKGDVDFIIDRYMHRKQDFNLEFNHEDEYMKLISIDIIKNEENINTKSFELEVAISYLLKEDSSNFYVGFELLNDSDQILFRTNDLNCNKGSERKAGVYKSIYKLNTNILKKGNYTISFIFVLFRIKWLSKGKIEIPIEVPYKVSSGLANPGIIEPLGHWELEGLTTSKHV